MKRWQQLMASYAALCVMLAGVVARDPLLHSWIDHGGGAAPHVHDAQSGRFPRSLTHIADSSEHGHVHSHLASSGFKYSTRRFNDRIAHTHGVTPLTLFGLQPQDLYRVIGHLVNAALEHIPTSPEGNDGHTHYTLSQLLLSGAVEGALAPDVILYAPSCCTFLSSLARARMPASEWAASSASRAPPVCC